VKSLLSLGLGALLATASISAHADSFELRFHNKGVLRSPPTSGPGGGSGPVHVPSTDSGNTGSGGQPGGSGGIGGTEGSGSTGSGGTEVGGSVGDSPNPGPGVIPAGYQAADFILGLSGTLNTLMNSSGEPVIITGCQRIPPGGVTTACTTKDSWPMSWPVGVGLQGVFSDNEYQVSLANGQTIVWYPSLKQHSVR